MFYFRCKTLRLQSLSEEFHEEAPFEDTHEFPYGIKTVHVPEVWFGFLAEQQHEDSL